MTSVIKFLGLSALALSGSAFLSGCTSAARDAKIEKAFPPIGEFVEVEGRKVHYLRAGSGPELVLLHGAGANVRDYTFDLFDLLKDRYTVTAFDRPGLGYTDRVPNIDTGPFSTEGDSPQAQAHMLREAAEKIGIKDPIVAGHSYGGIVALAWAVEGLDIESQQNASAIVSFAGVAMPWPDPLAAYYTINGSALVGGILVPILSVVVPDSVVEKAVNDTFTPNTAPDGFVAHLGAELVMRPDSFRANVRQVNTLQNEVIKLAPRYPELTIPIEILHGTDDVTVPIHIHANEIAKIVPSVHVTQLEGVGHQPHHVDVDAAIAAIDRAAGRAGLR